MKFFVLKTPWDYHGEAELVVFAESKEEALAKMQKEEPNTVKQWLGEQVDDDSKDPVKDPSNPKADKYGWVRFKKANEVEEIKGEVYHNEGCDC